MAPMPEVSLRHRLEQFVDAVQASPHNLVSQRASAELRTRHLPECLSLAARLPRGPAELVDVGSGGGFPGLVIAIARPDLEVTLIESTGKKADFLADTAARLGVATRVINDRIEAVAASGLAGTFTYATARAVAPLERLIPLTMPLLAPGGTLYAVKGEKWRDEVETALSVLERNHAQLVATPDDDPQAADGAAGTRLRVVIIGRNPDA